MDVWINDSWGCLFGFKIHLCVQVFGCRFMRERDRNRDRVQLIATRAVIQLITTRGHQRPQAGACAVTDPPPRPPPKVQFKYVPELSKDFH